MKKVRVKRGKVDRKNDNEKGKKADIEAEEGIRTVDRFSKTSTRDTIFLRSTCNVLTKLKRKSAPHFHFHRSSFFPLSALFSFLCSHFSGHCHSISGVLNTLL